MKILIPVLLVLFQPSVGSIAVPAGQRPVLSVLGRGFQVYQCDQPAGGTGPQWKFLAPQADLFLAEKKVGTHDAGPAWHDVDGSSVMGTVISSSPSADLGAVPQLLLRARSATGNGVLSRVTFIQRTQTQGGIAPQTGCDATHLGEVTKVLYQATYTFYAAR